MKTVCVLISLLALAATANGQTEKTEASKGFEKAMADISQLKLGLKKRTSEELVKSFVPTGRKTFGGYNYFYNYMANNAIRDELARRGADAEPVLRKNVDNRMRICEAINGPGATVSNICTELLEKLAE